MDQNLRMPYEEEQQRTKENMEQEKQQNEEKKVAYFAKMGGATLLYAAIFTACLYENLCGIAVVVWTLASVVYLFYVANVYEVKWKKDSTFLAAVMLLLGVSNFMTGNTWIIGLNYLAIFALMVVLLLHNFYEDGSWDIGTYLLAMARAVVGAVLLICSPFFDAAAYLAARQEKKNRKIQLVLVGICIAFPCILLLGGMLASADMVFSNLIQTLFYSITVPEHVVGIFCMLVFGFFSAYCGVRFIAVERRNVVLNQKNTGEPVLAITALSMVAALYLVFSVIQIVYLFLGNRSLPAGVTYAEYARQGFFQLLFICVLNLVAVLAIKMYVKEHRILNAVLLVICGCTLIMTASSAYRMLLYISVYYLTFLRVFVLVALLVIAFLMVGAGIYIVKKEFPFVRFSVAVVSILYLCLSFSKVDAIIADYNLNQVNRVDYTYISCLSSDAAPVIAAYLKQHPDGGAAIKDDAYDGWLYAYVQENRIMEERSLREYNRSYQKAAALLEQAF